MMAKYKYDAEMFLVDVRNIFRANLNDRIDLINTEKQTITSGTEDDFAIDKISDKAWYLSHVPKVMNYEQFVCWGLDDVTIEQAQPDGAKQKITVFVEVVIPDKGEKYRESTIYKLLRYSRALQDIALKNFDKIQGYGSIQVESLSPTLVSIDGKMLRTSGINVSASFGLR
jgi:hypothetical protein